ncbi:vascular endothelial growth factor receptor 3-like isoform X1 [Stylophora pistillata]|uniref:vascular endothelial growth factor receptor 3-like isoform X1 n=1 Tax=Stylophora pistillata TaxID=50429 RepID=UPI000C051128|nr:vascular endothelial growth factor receptor 3-like isoform X1 [Stylophora pistillata]
MEIYRNSSWQKLCTSNWNKVEEDLTCMAMGYFNSGDYGRWYEDRNNESETSINYNCTTILRKCEDHFSKELQLCKVPVRLNGANVEYGGRVEVFYKGNWGKICTSDWDFNDVKVICRQLGFQEALAEFIGSNVENENISTVMFDVSCTGNEEELASCARSDGKFNVPSQCQGDGKGSQALCQPKNKQVLGKEKLFFDIGNKENLYCSILNKTSFARWIINGKKMQNRTSPSERVQTKKDGELVIENVQLSDGGTYECYRLEYVQYYTVYINARFTENTQDEQSLVAYTSGIINCSAEGIPPPLITLSKQGRILLVNGGGFAQITSGNLRISLVQPGDNGTYICTMKQNKGPNRVTSTPKNILVSVIVRPEVSVSGASNFIIEGENVTLTCKIIQGQPQPQITWFKNNELKGNTMSLSFNDIKKEDAGLYTCEAKNVGGSSTGNINITVKVPPHLNPDLKNHAVPLNSTFIATCYVRGDPPVSVNWTKDGKALGHNNKIVIKPVTFDDEGIYKCTAYNRAGNNYTSFSINVTVSPQILLSPVNQSVIDGHPVNFTCRASGVPTPKVTWTFDDNELPFGINQTNFERDSFVESFLEMPRTTKEMKGTYKCTAKNQANSLSSSATLEVFVPPHLNPGLKNRSITLNSTFTTTCFVRGDPPVSIKWTKNGEALGNNNTLIIKYVTFDDEGFYECAAENLAGKASTSFWIAATVSPRILLSPVNQSVTYEDPVNFTCRASGVPTPKVTWTFKGGKLQSGINKKNFERDLFVESFLETPRTKKEMAGTYECTAENKANTISSSATLQVFEKPTAELIPKPYPTLTSGNELRLTCIANAATVNITWKKNGDQIKKRADIFTRLNETKSYLVIAKVVEEDSGVYSCEARNRLGNVARSTVTITVRVRSPSLVWYYIVGSVAAVIVILLVCWYFWKRRRTAVAMPLPNQGQAVEMELSNIEVDEWEVEVNRVLLQEVIGRGSFGAVWRALLSSPNGRPGNRTVAAKCFTPTAGEEGRKCLMREIELGKILGESNQPNIVKFIGCVTRQVHPILIMEYLPCGDLLGYMRKCRGIKDRYYLGEGRAQALNNYDLVLFAKQIAAGMVFLGSRGIIHRDLAARNVLLDNNYVCKVTDFGMAYQNFKYGHGNAKKGCLPIKWTPPEILLGNLAGLSTLSDVWSYGIVLYEIVTLGGIPYDGWSEGNVVAQVTHGYKLPKPDHVDDKLYAIMKRCWNFNPDFRPPFENLRRRMDTYLREETYLQLLDMGSYDTTKYSKVEDLGDEDAEPTVRATGSAVAKRLGKWASDRR